MPRGLVPFRPGELSPVQPMEAGTDWTRQIHRALRGRYRLCFILASLLAIIGFSLGWEWSGLLYRSEGMVRIASALPPVLKPTDQNQPIPMFDSFIQAQQELITSRSVLESAASDPLWTTRPLVRQRLGVEELASGLKVEARNKSENLRISFLHVQPEVAVAAVRSTITAYQNAYMRDHAEREQRRQRLLEDYRATLEAQLNALVADAGLAPSVPQNTASSSRTSPAAREAPKSPPRPSVMMLAQVDPEMKRLVDARMRVADEIDRERLVFGSRHPNMLRLKKDLELVSRRIETYVEEQHTLQLARLEERQRLQADQDAGKPAALPIASQTPASPAIQQLRTQIDDVNQRIEILKTEAAMPKRFEVVKNGDFPVVVPDRRIKTATIGSAMGAGLAVLTMIIAGLFRREYHFCADVADDLSSHTPYVAAIPDLTRNDLRREADAVQCIHHLRQTLDTQHRIYMVSSAVWGSGQTSVTMSLALSLAAAGSRTLVIDADPAARGLSTALKLEKEVGLADVLSGCELEFCIKTNHHGLNILPAGLQVDQAGLAFTQAQIASLFERVREKFDVVLIDSAPMLASAEPAMIARNVDGVLLTLSRGQNRKLVARAIREMQHARAAILGAVFNRVSLKDFDESIPQRPRLIGMPATRYRVPDEFADICPLVRAVAGALRTPFEMHRYVEAKLKSTSRIDLAQQTAESVAA